MQEYNSKYNQFSNSKIQKQKVNKILLPGPPFPSHKYFVKLVNPENRPPEKSPTFFSVSWQAPNNISKSFNKLFLYYLPIYTTSTKYDYNYAIFWVLF